MRALVRPGVRSDELTVLYTVVSETSETFTLDDGYTDDEQPSAVRGAAGRSALNSRMAVTEGSVMFGAWLSLTRSSPWPHPLRWLRKPR